MLEPGIYSLVIGGTSLADLTSLIEQVQQGTPQSCTDVYPSCNETFYGHPSDSSNPAMTDDYFKLRGKRTTVR